MPSPTYHKLDVKKQERFYSVALDEFSTHGYHQASITKIVSKLGIAKGSVYQYFDDKYDLYRYLLTSSVEKLTAIRYLIDTNFEGDLNQWFISRCISEIKFMKQFPKAHELIIKTLADRSGELMEIQTEIKTNENKAINNVLNASNAKMKNTLAYAIAALKDKYLGELKPDKDDKQIAEELISLSSVLFMTN